MLMQMCKFWNPQCMLYLKPECCGYIGVSNQLICAATFSLSAIKEVCKNITRLETKKTPLYKYPEKTRQVRDNKSLKEIHNENNFSTINTKSKSTQT